MDATIRTLPPGERITEAGFYRISLARHHAQPCDGPSVTSGILRTLDLKSPADVWAFHPLNPDRYPSETTPAMLRGQAMAAFVEGGIDGLQEAFYVLPTEPPRRPTPAQRKAVMEGRGSDTAVEAVEFWDSVEGSPRPVLSVTDTTEILLMGGALVADPAARAVMAGEPEITMAWRDDETGLWCLSRPDVVSLDGAAADYKRMAAGGRPFNAQLVDRRITDHGYDMQMAFAAEALERLTGSWPTAVGIVAQSDAPPFHVILRGFDDDTLRLAQWRNRRALRTFRSCLEAGRWPGPGEHVGTYRAPEWLLDRWLTEKSADDLARQGQPEGDGLDFIQQEDAA